MNVRRLLRFPWGSDVRSRRVGLLVGLILASVFADAGVALATPAYSQVAGSPFTAGSQPWSVAFSPSGGLLADANKASNTVSMFSVASGGALTAVTGSPFATGSQPFSVAFSPSGGLLATANRASNTVSVFAVGSGGALTAVTGSPFATGSQPYSVAFSPSGGLLAVANEVSNTVSVFAVGSGGALTAVTGSPFATGNGPYSVAFSPSGGLLAVANETDNTVSVFAVGSDGALTAVTGSPFATGNGPFSVAFSPTGGLLATGNYGNTTSVFSIGSGGALTNVTGSPFSSGTTTRAVAFNSSGGLLAAANFLPNAVSVFSVGSGGALTAVTGSPFADGGNPDSVAFSPSGLFATANLTGGNVSVFVPLAPSVQTGSSITGSATLGQTLTANPGTFSDSAASLSYQWQDCDSSGNNCVPIGGATSSTYTVSTGDVGHTIVVVVTATNVGGSASSSSPQTIVVTPPAPTNSTPPAITGAPTVGQTLTASPGTWSDSQAALSYQWQDCDSSGNNCVAIGGATSSTYTVATGDVGHTIVVVVTATNVGGSASSSSASTAVVASGAAVTTTGLVNVTAPVISGTDAVGNVLQVSTGTWSANTTGFSYQWLRDGLPIPGATGSSYTVQIADQGHSLTCQVTATDASGASASSSSAGVTIPIVNVHACPEPSGELNGTTLGPVTLGETRIHARQAMPRFTLYSYHTDNFCLADGYGIRVGYASARLLGSTTWKQHKAMNGKVVLALTANPYYTLDGVHPGTRLSTVARKLGIGKAIHTGLNHWYVLPRANGNGVLKVRHGIIQEVGIANHQLTNTRSAQVRLLRNF
jgi:6-phosphogluconolactonase